MDFKVFKVVTGGFKGLQWVRRGYRGFARGYRRLLGVVRG